MHAHRCKVNFETGLQQDGPDFQLWNEALVPIRRHFRIACQRLPSASGLGQGLLERSAEAQLVMHRSR